MRARTEEAKDERRAAFLDAAMDAFFENGFAATRVDDIAQRAGLSKGTLYLYFKSKEEVFQALIDSIAVPKIEQIEALVGAAPSASAAIGNILGFAPTIVRQSKLPRIIKVIIADGARFPAVTQSYRTAVIDRGLGVITALLERGKKEGAFDIDDPALTARLVIAPMVFSMLWHILFEQKATDGGGNGVGDGDDLVDLDALFSLHRTLLMRALAPAGGPSQ